MEENIELLINKNINEIVVVEKEINSNCNSLSSFTPTQIGPLLSNMNHSKIIKKTIKKSVTDSNKSDGGFAQESASNKKLDKVNFCCIHIF